MPKCGIHIALQFETLICNFEIYPAIKFWNRASQESAILIINHTITIDIRIFKATFSLSEYIFWDVNVLRSNYARLYSSSVNFRLILEYSSNLISVKGGYGLTHLVPNGGNSAEGGVDICQIIYSGRNRNDFVFQETTIHGDFVFKTFGDISPVDHLNVHPFVNHFANVNKWGAGVNSVCCRYRNLK